jgi:transposase
MANHLKSMNEIKQVLRFHHERNVPIKAIARELGMSKNTVKEYLNRFRESGLSLQEVLAAEPVVLADLLRPDHASASIRYSQFLEHADQYLSDLKNQKHLSKQLLWEEEFYKGRTAYRYSQFCHHLLHYERSKSGSMVLKFSPADKLMVDFAGDKLYITDPDSGKLTPCEVLVLTLAYSHKCIAIALPSQRLADLLFGLSLGVEYFGAVPQSLVCDNMRTAVKRSSRYEPEVNESLLDWANHYGMSVLTTRVRKPKDKARVEGSVNHIYSQVYGRMRNHVYYSLEELNASLRSYCNDLNQRVMKKYGVSRDALYQKEERALMRPLPENRYKLIERYVLHVGQNGHVYLGKRKQYYSVPYHLIGQKVHVVLTHDLVKVYHKSSCVATHPVTGGMYSTVSDHLASHHQAYLESMNPKWLISQGGRIGKDVELVIEQVLVRTRHPEQNYKTCQGILALQRKHSAQRVNAACAFALHAKSVTYTNIKRLCESPYFTEHEEQPQTANQQHANIRGASNYK